MQDLLEQRLRRRAELLLMEFVSVLGRYGLRMPAAGLARVRLALSAGMRDAIELAREAAPWDDEPTTPQRPAD